MKLTEAASVLEKLGVSDNTDSVLAAEAGLEFATTQIENVLNTPLRKQVIQDTFSYNPGRYYNPATFSNLQLVASQGFWLTTPAPKVYLSLDGAQLIGDISGLTELDPIYYIVNYEQGSVTLLTAPLAGAGTIALVYTAGYEEGAENVPKWLVQAAIGYACQTIGLHGVGYNKKEYRDKSGEKRGAAYSVLSNHIRTRRGMHPTLTAVS